MSCRSVPHGVPPSVPQREGQKAVHENRDPCAKRTNCGAPRAFKKLNASHSVKKVLDKKHCFLVVGWCRLMREEWAGAARRRFVGHLQIRHGGMEANTLFNTQDHPHTGGGGGPGAAACRVGHGADLVALQR